MRSDVVAGICPPFDAEGIAEHFAVHRWDGKVLKPASIPNIGTKDESGDGSEEFHRTLGIRPASTGDGHQPVRSMPIR